MNGTLAVVDLGEGVVFVLNMIKFQTHMGITLLKFIIAGGRLRHSFVIGITSNVRTYVK